MGSNPITSKTFLTELVDVIDLEFIFNRSVGSSPTKGKVTNESI